MSNGIEIPINFKFPDGAIEEYLKKAKKEKVIVDIYDNPVINDAEKIWGTWKRAWSNFNKELL